MLLVSIGLAVLGVVGLLLLAKRSASVPPETASRAVATPAALVPDPRPPAPGPRGAVDTLAWIRAESLPESRRQSMAAVFRHVPRPPRLLQKLISPEIVNDASLEELTDLISSEPLVAARVLATANSSMFGLSEPVTGLRQAIAVLGLITLRSLCVQYMLIRSFKADGPERQTLLTNLWNASSFASELSLRLARALGRPEPGRLVTLVVLSFLGRLATAATMPRGLLGRIPVGSFLDKSRQEQEMLGLSSSEIGGLLMREWDLPPSLIDEVREVDPTLVRPDADFDLALCYLCARLGERLASGELRSLDDFELGRTEGPDFQALEQRQDDPAWQRVARALAEPGLREAMQRMTAGVRAEAELVPMH